MSHSWLQRKRKGELIELAQRANMPDADTYLKDDLVEALEQHLEANETTYAKVPDFRDFYGRTSSPVKRERSSPSETVAMVKTRRRQTLVSKPEPDESTPESNALTTRTPRNVSRVASRVSQVDIPASPAQLAEVADQSFQAMKGRANQLWTQSKIDEAKDWLRENASSVTAIQMLVLLTEAAGLQWNTLVTNEVSKLPPSVDASQSSIKMPDGFLLFTSEWWAPATLWSLTSWFLPLVLSYFFNLTLRSNTNHKSSSRQSTIDPLTFNIVRALLAYTAFRPHTVDDSITVFPGAIVFGNVITYAWGPFAASTVRTVYENVPGSYYGMQIGSVVGVLVSLYDAALKK